MGLFDIFKKKIDDISVDVKPSMKISTSVSTMTLDDVPSIKERIKNAFPSKNGLYPHEILMLEYASSYKAKDNRFQSFWQWDYSVKNPQKLLDSLFARGFVCFAKIEESVSKAKLTELKELLTNKGEKTSGKKAELVERVLSVYDSTELEQIFPEKRYSLTELGQEETRENEYVIYCHRKKYISPWEMNILMHNRTNPNFSYRDVMWEEFNRLSMAHAIDKNFGLYRNTRLQMSEFVEEEERLLQALDFLIEVVAYDLSGLGNNEKNILEMPKDIRINSKLVNFFKDEEKKEVSSYPGVVARIVKLRSKLDMSDNEFINYVYEASSKIQIDNRIFSDDECANILLALLGLEERKIVGSYDVAVKRVKKMIK